MHKFLQATCKKEENFRFLGKIPVFPPIQWLKKHVNGP